MFKSPARRSHYVGTLPEAARRTKARRMGAPIYFKLAHVEGPTGSPGGTDAGARGARTEFVDAFWRSKEWQQTPWLGAGRQAADRPVRVPGAHRRLRPDWIIETGTGGGGRAFFLATICDLIDHGRVISIDDYPVEKLVEHPRIEYVRRDPADPGDGGGGARDRRRETPRDGDPAAGERAVTAAFYEHYGPLVPVGSYVVLEDTILNGNPVWTGFGPGPREAARRIVGGRVRGRPLARSATASPSTRRAS